MTLQELNEKYFELYSDLYAAKPYLPTKQFETMYKALFEDYCIELETVVGEKELATGYARFTLHFKLKNYLPRRVFLCLNKIAKRTLKRLKAEFIAELAEMEKETQEIKENQTSERSDTDNIEQSKISAVATLEENKK